MWLRPSHAAHEAEDFRLGEHRIDKLRAAGPPLCQLRLADAAEMLPLLLGQRRSHQQTTYRQ